MGHGMSEKSKSGAREYFLMRVRLFKGASLESPFSKTPKFNLISYCRNFAEMHISPEFHNKNTPGN